MMRFCFVLALTVLSLVATVHLYRDGTSTEAEAAPATNYVVPGCPLLGTRTLAAKIFGPYEWSAGGGKDFPAGRTMAGYLPAGATIVECGFVRKWDANEQAATPDSDILLSGSGQLNDSAALMETWNHLTAGLGLHTSQQGVLHFAERPGFSAGYRDGLNTIAYAYWMVNMEGDFENVPASRLRPFVTTIVCAGNKC
ncbi:MAG: hypothetical protein JO219_04300 [Candidatus Eremiobacteraeota bacterium]|nr:hypothetical protein [Candidatus Eremiobacteraeota bacterium]MBV8365256.1 hypothetical protein [Candidatus Eremiobacteraeota bacterium]